MASYPLQIHPKPPRSREPKLLNEFLLGVQVARRIEDYLNEQMASVVPGEGRTFTYHDIAEALYMSKESVHELLSANGGGSNGITIGKPDSM
jgi:hypothetical protein